MRSKTFDNDATDNEAFTSEGDDSSTSDGSDLSDEEATNHILGGMRGDLRLKGDQSTRKATLPSKESEERIHSHTFPNGIFKVGAVDSVDASKLEICQICHHLNADFMQCDQYTSNAGPWATLSFKDAERLRSCTLNIDNGQTITLNAISKPCLYCGLLCTALSWERPGWESRASVVEMQVAWDLPITLKLRYTSINRTSGDGVFGMIAPGLENPGARMTVSVSRKEDLPQIVEIYQPTNRSASSGDLPFLKSLGTAPVRSECSDSELCYHFMRKYVSRCISGTAGHETCNQKRISTLPSRILHVGSTDDPFVRIVNGQHKRASYITLSYRWGTAKFLQTTKSCLQTFKDKIDWELLPALFQDTITISRKLGIAYVWIDSLCIVQDDPKDWEDQVDKMGDIYANSHVTITAASVSSPHGRILGSRHPRWHPRPFNVRDNDGNLVGFAVREQIPPGDRRGKGPNPDHTLKRAWIWQERLISARSLVFTSAAIRFECHQSSIWEDQSFPSHSWSARLEIPPKIYWKSLIQNYTRRDMTKSSDRLPAIEAVMKLIQNKFDVTPVAGMWRETLSQELHWTKIKGGAVKPHASTVAPSWSWASVDGPIHWTLGVYDRLPASDKVWDLKILDLTMPPSAGGRVSVPTLITEGRVLMGTIYSEPREPNSDRMYSRYRLIIPGSVDWHRVGQDCDLEQVDTIYQPRYRTVRRKLPGTGVDNGDWYNECGILLLVTTGSVAHGLVIARSVENQNCWERIGSMETFPIEYFQNVPRAAGKLQ